MTSGRSKALIVCGDPSDLEKYSLLVTQAGVVPLTAQVQTAGLNLPKSEPVDLVLFDYGLKSLKTPAELAREIRHLFPSASIVVLSNLWSMPADIEPYASAFVRKCESAKLVGTISRLVEDAKQRRTKETSEEE